VCPAAYHQKPPPPYSQFFSVALSSSLRMAP